MGTTSGENLRGCSCLYPFTTIGLTSSWCVWYISKNENIFFSYTWVPPFIIFSLKDMPTIHKSHRSLTDLLYRSMDGGSFAKTFDLILNCSRHYLRPYTFVSGIQCVFLTSHFTWNCFTASEPVQYPGKVALVPCKHSNTTSEFV